MSACGAGCGITKARERDKEAALAAIERAYRGGVWTPERSLPDLALPADGMAALGASLERLLPVRAIPRVGDAAGCDWLYLLAGLHSPSLLEVFEGVAVRGHDTPATETHIRIGFSRLGPFVTLQEVVLTLEGDELVEEPVLGVSDRRLQGIVKGLQGALRKAHLVVLDMAFLVDEVRAAGNDAQQVFAERYGSSPTRWSFLFDAAPPVTPRATSLRDLPRSAGPSL